MRLNENLPEEYFAEFQVTLGTRVEVDVATFTEAERSGTPAPQRPRHGRANARSGRRLCLWP